MTHEVKWACIRRLEARLQNEGTLDYPQAAHDALMALRELHRFQDDSEHLRAEKVLVWRTVNSPEIRVSWTGLRAAWHTARGLWRRIHG